ncbi:MAG: Holliday junction resolvase RuvX [Actinomycetota bacterium]
MPGERVLGLDLGQARIGVSISDERGRLAVPFGTIHTGAPQDVKAIAKLVAEHDIGRIVVGLPLSLKGERGAAAAHAERFAEALRGFLDVPVELQDERLSTVEADRALKQTGAGGRQRRRAIDASAATVILQSWLDTHRRD